MSSFICSATHFNSIQAKTIDLFLDQRFNAYSFNEYDLYNRPEDEVRKTLQELFTGLRELNVFAYHFQYRQHYETTLDQEIQAALIEINQKTPIRRLSFQGLYNGLACLNYQIEEDHLIGIREDLFGYKKFLEILKSNTAEFICSIAEEDKTNVWEIN